MYSPALSFLCLWSGSTEIWYLCTFPKFMQYAAAAADADTC